MQALFEKLALQMIDHYLGDILKDTGKLAFAGGCALNVKLNQKIIARDDVKELFVQPASGDAGTAVGAAAYVSHARGVPVEKMEHVYLGPSYSNEDVIAACAKHASKPVWRKIENMPKRIAKIMVDGNPVAWFQAAWSLARARWAVVRSLVAQAPPAWRIASTTRSSSASAGGLSARRCSTPLRHR